MTSTAQAAVAAAQRTRERMIKRAASAYLHDLAWLSDRARIDWRHVTYAELAVMRTVNEACLAHLDEIERHLPDSPRRGMLNDYYGDSEDSE